MLDAKRQKSQAYLKNNLINGFAEKSEGVRPLSSFYPVLEDHNSSLQTYIKKRKINAIQFQKVKSEK